MLNAYNASAQQLANWMFSASIPTTFVAQALVAVYGTSDVQTTAILRLAGYPAGEVYVALKTVFGTGLHEAEDILIAGGFTNKEAFMAVQEDLLAWYEGLIQQYGPVVYLHPDEGYEMSSIDWFFENTELYYRLDDVEYIYNGQISATNLYQVATDLIQQGADKIWLGTPDPIKPADPEYKSPGFQESAEAYVHAQRIKHLGYTDLQFWLWYPYNGPGSFHTDIRLETFLQTHTLEDGVDQPEDYGK